MKKLISSCAFALVALAGMAFAQTSPSVTIGKYNPESKDYEVYEDRLNWRFKDGGQITSFKIDGPPSKARLIRMGKDANGRCRTEMIPVVVSSATLDVDFTSVLVRVLGCFDNDEFACSSQAEHPWQRTECRWENSGGSYGCECWFWLTNDVVSISLPDTKCELRRGPPEEPEEYDLPDIVAEGHLP